MKALIVMKEEKCGWLRNIIPNHHPGMMTLCNKPLLEYLLDFAILCGSSQIRFVMDGTDRGMEEYFGNGSKWGVDLSYAPARSSDNLETTLKKNSGFVENSPLLIIDGFFFIRHNKNEDYGSLFSTTHDGPKLSCANGTILYRKTDDSPRVVHTPRDSGLEVLPLGSIRDFHTLSMEILARNAGHYVLPGYNNEEGVFIGRNVTISKTTTINKPVLLGNNVQLQKNTEIGPGAIIGSNVIVDSGTRISNSIILDNSYVGAELTVKDKILRTDMAISAETGTAVHFVDDHLLSGIQYAQVRNIPRSIIQWCLACLLYITGCIPAFLFRLFLKTGNNWQQRKETILRGNGEPQAIQLIEIGEDSLAGKLARGLAVDKIMLLPLVLTGKIDLVGNKPFPATPEGKNLHGDFVNYLPGVFFFSEAENIEAGDFLEEITERFFAANRSLAGDLKTIFKTLINRW